MDADSSFADEHTPEMELDQPETADDLVAGVCRFCRCEELKPCDGGCAWTDETQTLCTTCLNAVAVLQVIVQALGIFAAKPKHGIHISKARWDALELQEQRGLVMQFRLWIDQVQDHLAAEMGETAQANAEEMDAIASFLLEQEVQVEAEETLSAVVIRLLGPQVGSRIIVPAGASR